MVRLRPWAAGPDSELVVVPRYGRHHRHQRDGIRHVSDGGLRGFRGMGSDHQMLTGATFGAGVEYRLGKSETIGVEYRHSRYGSQAFHLSNVTADVSGAGAEPIVGTVGSSTNDVTLRVTVPLHAK